MNASCNWVDLLQISSGHFSLVHVHAVNKLYYTYVYRKYSLFPLFRTRFNSDTNTIDMRSYFNSCELKSRPKP